MNRESVLLLGGARALLLQLAHPLVAQGVADHSDFLRAPLGRLRSTLDATYTVLFADPASVRRTARAVRRAHERVRGTLQHGTAAFPAGTAYRATDPELLLWVHASLVDSALATYQTYVARLSLRQRQAFYAQIGWLGRIFGVPEAQLPPTFEAFRHYLRDMLEGPMLEITPTARQLADAVLHPPIAWVPRWIGDATGVLTLGLLPAELRERYGFAWNRAHARAFDAARALLRRTLPLLPDALRAVPQARRAERAGRGRAARS
ncbi:MAG: DUF2236 domain-containing protein [Deltaproteobacteria bacterium]|nr:MAG: DUF2236 domain-containing protein [Deltaproteobacteria bacterium]